MTEKWQQDIAEALENGQLKLMSFAEMEVRRRAQQRKAFSDWYGAWRMAFKNGETK